MAGRSSLFCFIFVAVAVFAVGCSARSEEPTPAPAVTPVPADFLYGFGQPASQAQIEELTQRGPTWMNLPAGSGTATDGRQIFVSKCSECHGDQGQGGLAPQLVGDPGPWQPGEPQTIGSYWPFAPTIFDYISRAMPFPAPGSLTHDEVYSLVAYLLNANDIIEVDEVMDAESLLAVEMPNRDQFIECWPDSCFPDTP